MPHASIDMVRQSGWDLWTIVCAAAAVTLGLRWAIFGRGRFVETTLSAVGITGTLLVLCIPLLHSPMIGLFWTWLLLSILSTVLYLHMRMRLTLPRLRTLLSLRLVAIFMLTPMLFEPVLRYVQKTVPERPLLLLVDTSGSMSVPDVANGPTRLQASWLAISPQMDRIRSAFVPAVYTFDSDAKRLQNPAELSHKIADGKTTDLVNAVKHALSASPRDDSAIVLITDGNDNVSANAVDALRGIGRPINTVRVGSDQAQPTQLMNVAVDSVTTPDQVGLGQKTPVRVIVRSSALADRVVQVHLAEVNDAGAPVGEVAVKPLVLKSSGSGQVLSLPYKPTAVGVHTISAWIDPIPGERTTVDNRQSTQVLVIDPRIKVLYVEGRARPEYRELNRALGRDSNVELATLLRVQAERFAASGTVDGKPFTQLPNSADGWGRFDVIILGDLDASFLSASQQALVEQRVLAGAGLLMIGGQNNFGPGGYQGTPIEKLLPVFVGDRSIGQDTAPFVPHIAAGSTNQPILQGLTDWFAATEKKLPDLRGNVIVRGPKSGATVLLVHDGQAGPDGNAQVVLATQRYGSGRSAALTVDTTYLWYLPLRGLGQESPYNRMWGQMVRWLAGQDVKDRAKGAGLSALLDKTTYTLGQSPRIRSLVRDAHGDATRFAAVTLNLTAEGKPPQPITLTPDENQAGLFAITLPDLPVGNYTADITATKDDKPLGKQTLSFSILPPADEMLKIAANPKLLAAIANETHGFHYDLAQFPDLIDTLIRQDPTATGPRQQAVPLDNIFRGMVALISHAPTWPEKYDLPMQGGLVFALLTTEWVLRRRWQLS